MGKAKSPRSFNTIRHSQTKQRAKRRELQRIVLLLMLAAVALILVSLLALGACSIFSAIASATPEQTTDGGDPSTPPPADSGEIQYTQSTNQTSKIYEGALIMVNADHEYRFPTVNLLNVDDNKAKVNGANVYQVPYPNYKLEANALAALNAMMLKYYDISNGDGSIRIPSAHRTYDEQNTGQYATPAGFSEHHTGYCFTLRLSNPMGGYLEADHWIYENCHKYGLVARYPADKVDITGVSAYAYCFRYVGVAHATYMKEHNLCLEEYLGLLKSSYSSGTNLKINAADGNAYEVYYAPASMADDLTQFRVPVNFNYTVSGDNDSGFIITVNLSEKKE